MYCPALCKAVYLVLGEMAPDAELWPRFMFNEDPGLGSEWKYVAVECAPPACVDPEISGSTNIVALKRTSMLAEPLLPTALLNGVHLLKREVELVMAAYSIPPPERGTGVDGRVLRADLVRTLVTSVLKDHPQEVQEKVMTKMGAPDANNDQEETSPEDPCPDEILELLQSMDPDNKEHFKGVVKKAVDMLEKRAKKENAKARAQARAQADSHKPEASRSSAEAADKGTPTPGPAKDMPGSSVARPRVCRKLTPDRLKDLLPPLDDEKVYLKWKLKDRQVQVEFIGALPALQHFCVLDQPQTRNILPSRDLGNHCLLQKLV